MKKTNLQKAWRKLFIESHYLRTVFSAVAAAKENKTAEEIAVMIDGTINAIMKLDKRSWKNYLVGHMMMIMAMRQAEIMLMQPLPMPSKIEKSGIVSENISS